MSLNNPLTPIHQNHGQVSYRPYGPQDSGPGEGGLEIVDGFGEYELEYAAIRKGVGVMDLPQTGVVKVTGADRLDFLQRMLTQDMTKLNPGEARRSFLLNKSGRIIADMMVLHETDQTYLMTDLYQASTLAEGLEQYLFSEDVQIEDTGSGFLRLAMHGPGAAVFLHEVCGQTVADLLLLQHCRVTIADQTCVCLRHDETGGPGLHLLCPRDGVVDVYQEILRQLDVESGDSDDTDPQSSDDSDGNFGGSGGSGGTGGSGVSGGRLIGWEAYNTARIEFGTPLYNIDFGPDSLPHETGVLDERVSFTKGCYLGQEIVARMQSLGHPKRILVGLRLEDDSLPFAGSQVFTPAESDSGNGVRRSSPGAVIGAITSSTVSPMLGRSAVAFAMVKWGQHKIDTELLVPAEGQMVCARVCELRFVK